LMRRLVPMPSARTAIVARHSQRERGDFMGLPMRKAYGL
jgi:hypothetical protein